MKSFHLACLLMLGTVLATQAQRIDPDPLYSTKPEPDRRWVVKFAPLSLFDPDNTIQFGIERLVSQHSAVQLELGYGVQAMNLWQTSQNERYGDREIWRGRAEWRYYFTPTNQPQGRYIALEGFYKQVNIRESGSFGVGCNGGPCQYYQLFSAPLQKYVWGGHVKVGRQFALTADNRLLADVYLGLGFRKRTVERFQPPDDSYYYPYSDYTLFNTYSSIPYAIISVAYGAKIGYSF